MCPTEDTDNHLANYPHKTKPQIVGLTVEKDFEASRKMSQQVINNATYQLRFGSQSDRGIHGACPMEMLHATLLGIFRCMRDCLFSQMGVTSKLADTINGLAQKYGELLSRQSDRDCPKTRFAQGVIRGELMAKEYPGILLCLAAVLRSTEGSEELKRKRPAVFGQEGQIEDWLLLIETLLEWEMWLKSDKMSKKHAHGARKRHQQIMYCIKKVGNRAEGMGFKISKFHQILHMVDDMFQFSTPMEYDTGANESGHKETKIAAKLTQKKSKPSTNKRLSVY